MTKQIKVPLLPLPPVEERVEDKEYLVLTEYFRFLTVGWCPPDKWHEYGSWAVLKYDDDNLDDSDIIGIVPWFTVQDGHMVFEVEE